MKSFPGLLLLVLMFLFYHPLQADCGGGSLSVFPKKTTVSPNTKIALNASYDVQLVIEELDRTAPAFLVSGDDTVALDLIETCHGMFDTKQAVLRPQTLLKKGLTYTLIIPNSPYNTFLTRPIEGKDTPISWTVSQPVDLEVPQWEASPELDFMAVDYFGCGPSVYAVFNLKAREASEYLIRTELHNLNTKNTTTYSLPLSSSGQLEVGHGMCSGPFQFSEKTDYQIRFSIEDASGNYTFWTAWQDLPSPFDVESQSHPLYGA